MLLNQAFSIKEAPRALFWISIFLISFSGMFYLGLNAELIEKWYLVLVIFNVVMSLVAIYYIVLSMKKLKMNTQEGVIGSKFTWSFIKIVPVLVLVPVLSFYLFSFGSIRDNLQIAESKFDEFNLKVGGEVDELYRNTSNVAIKYYDDRTRNIGKLVNYFDAPSKSAEEMQTVLNLLVQDSWACELKLYDSNMNLVASSKSDLVCLKDGITASTNEFSLIAHYSSDFSIDSLTSRMTRFRDAAKDAELTLNSSIIKTRFMIDFSSTILLAVLSALLIVLRMIDQLMRPMHNLSIATREISSGNYDVQIEQSPKNTDMNDLIEHFNEMSSRIKMSREGLDTHNLYLETILKYSFGVIALNQYKKIQLINPVIGKMLQIKDETIFISKSYDAIIKDYPNLEPLFSFIEKKIGDDLPEWNGEVELTLKDRYRLIYCQGAVLDIENKSLGYVIIINDISKLNRAQKKAAWGEVAVRMAHEIKNPLTPILLSAQRLRNLFLDKLDTKDSAIINKTTQTIIDQVASMDSMVSAFANYANTPEIVKVSTSLNALINKSVALYDNNENLRIDLDLSGDLPELQIDKDAVSRVIINLIKNSIEAKKDDGILNIKIKSRFKKDEGLVRFTMIDDGSGFPEDIIDQIFEPYITTKEKSGGLGLAIVQNIIEQHEGQIFASNVEPQGARITIEFSIIKPVKGIKK
ncbi:PAS domain-containing sensor histidine kinase [Candidatus Thioglobus sp. NP1]|uniref:sensor histidine kinase n=1 Tax=Candidatus Thioglobus sp. NP1 TaxID=2508687 RepID=UPI000DED8DC1|nr:ATP-binding protein [Candidatus Thioglobus sp. NP1]AXE61861.1 two-component sensor histidine kinase [Candidatus Thioglobus sp. NP1]